MWCSFSGCALWDHPRMRGEDLLTHIARASEQGSPPHARGRLKAWSVMLEGDGITPACAGKTLLRSFHATENPDHPRMRGEDQKAVEQRIDAKGSPPHARGRPFGVKEDSITMGITPACAGKTCRPRSRRRRPEDHPRMRGEDSSRPTQQKRSVGSPPHARGRHAR